jgi:hypothetical protein
LEKITAFLKTFATLLLVVGYLALLWVKQLFIPRIKDKRLPADNVPKRSGRFF